MTVKVGDYWAGMNAEPSKRDEAEERRKVQEMYDEADKLVEPSPDDILERPK